jgi:hypothetical protein
MGSIEYLWFPGNNSLQMLLLIEEASGLKGVGGMVGTRVGLGVGFAVVGSGVGLGEGLDVVGKKVGSGEGFDVVGGLVGT